MLKNLGLIVFFIIVFFLAEYFKLEGYFHVGKWYILAFFGALSYLSHLLIESGFENKRENFVQFYMISVVLRMILILVFVAVGIYFFPENQMLFAINIFVFYLFFTFFEISTLLRKLRRF